MKLLHISERFLKFERLIPPSGTTIQNDHMNRLNQIRIIALILKLLREGKRYSQEQVRNAIQIDVSHFECGQVNPGLHTTMRLCDYYGVDFRYIVGLAEQVDCGILSEKELYQKLRRPISDDRPISSVE
jgi:hypothetical protein